MRELLETFFPRNDSPLLVSFANQLHRHGFSTVIDFDFWDLRAYNGSNEPEISVLTIKNHLSPRMIERISQSESPYKIILVEGNGISLKKIEHQARFLAMLGVGIYLRNAGWLILPGNPKIRVSDDLKFQILDKYTQDERGTWGKFCTKCGVWYPHDQFYKNPNPNARDPHRNLCKSCHD
jgi:hypothetical protein